MQVNNTQGSSIKNATRKNTGGRKKKGSVWRSIIGGVIGGWAEASSLHPLDTIKTRLQLAGRLQTATTTPIATSVGANAIKASTAQKIHTGIMDCGTALIREEGFFALYKGLSPFLVNISCKYFVRFGVNFQLREAIAKYNGTPNTTVMQNLACGMAAGTTEALLVVTPFEVVKTKLQAQVTRTSEKGAPMKYRGPIDCAAKVVQKYGFGALWKGAGPTVFRQATNQASMFTAYSWMRKNVWGLDASKSSEGLLPWQAALTGLVASCVGPLLNCPADVIKTRLQVQTHSMIDPTGRGHYKGFVDAYFRIWREEGYAALYKGIVPRLARLAPGQAITW
eukprot:CAMPEP_0184488088 /NCGR_PEP_ID=MMETSP0113_2-20130426/10520_1 /TAXON_ID=91329 /ORGANISM="Norrisiella sphaerica, Strain BC52" /LENGTH=336 /DNA_ID=CAMNT_0026870565 /DNA_START=367 /DNA_END=1374 /DNA_ORIENTATION=+